jgi:hypothetical protein
VLSEALGWGIVPETVARADGPFGPGGPTVLGVNSVGALSELKPS